MGHASSLTLCVTRLPPLLPDCASAARLRLGPLLHIVKAREGGRWWARVSEGP
jgi:hypothetical protein